MNSNTKLVGKILDSEWGYNRTVVDYYVIVRETEKTLWFVKIAKKSVDVGYGWNVVPNMEDAKHIVKKYNKNSKSLNVIRARKLTKTKRMAVNVSRTNSIAEIWNGQPRLETLD